MASQGDLIDELDAQSSDAKLQPAQPVNVATLDRLPDELLLQICSQLTDLEPVSRTCKRLMAITKDVHLRAQCFLQRFQPYEVLYQAILRPKICSSQLIELLLKDGAVLSRNLMHLLYVAHDPATRVEVRTAWASSLSGAAYNILRDKANELYGDWYSQDTYEPDDIIFEGRYHSSAFQLERLEEKIKASKYVPLPVHFSQQYLRFCMEHSHQKYDRSDRFIVLWPELVPLLRLNGYEGRYEDRPRIYRTLFSFTHPRVGPVSLKPEIDLLQDAGSLLIPRTAAANSLVALCTRPTSEGLVVLDVLIALHREGKLDFDLEHLLQQILAPFRQGALRAKLIQFMRVVRAHFPSIDVSKLDIQYVFLQSEDLDALAMGMEQHVVTEEDVMQACLRNDCTSVAPIRYAMSFIKDFNVEGFITRLVDNLLHQPYREHMLRELERFTCTESRQKHAELQLNASNVDFKSILGAAVEKWTLTHSQIPSREWSKNEQNDRILCNIVPPIRSLLAFDWYQQSACAINFARASEVNLVQLKPYLPTTPAGLAGFTYFKTQDEHERQQNGTKAADVRDLEPRAADEELEPVELMALRKHDITEEDAEKYYARAYARGPLTYDLLSSQRESYQNIFGPLSKLDKDAHIAKGVVDILGPTSNAAHVVLSHAIANENKTLIADLLRKGLAPSLELFKIAVRAEVLLPKSLFEQIEAGAPFRVSYVAEENVPDPTCEAADIVEELSEEEIQQCRAFAAASAWPRTISADVDATGKLHIETVATPRTSPIETIVSTSNLLAKPGESFMSNPTSKRDQADTRAMPGEELPISYSIKLDDKHITMDRNTYLHRLESAKLWALHLRHLKSSEVKLHAALNVVFEAEGEHHAARSAARRDIVNFVRRLDRIVEDLQRAVPMLKPNMTLSELRAMWVKLKNTEGVGEQIMQQVNSFVQGSSSQLSERSQHVPHAFDESQQFEFDGAFKKEGAAAEDAAAEPAPKRVKLKHEQSNEFHAGGSADGSRDPARSQSPRNADKPRATPHPVYDHPLFDPSVFLDRCEEARLARKCEAIAKNCYLEELRHLEDELAAHGDFVSRSAEFAYEEQLAESLRNEALFDDW